MAAFEYQALNGEGKKKKGVISADSQRAARRELRKQSLTPIKLTALSNTKQQETSSGEKASKRRLKHSELVLLTRQLAMLISSGTPIEQAVGSVGSGATDPSTRAVLASVRSKVVEGKSLSVALRSEPKSFPPLYSAIVKAGEESSALGNVLERLADYQEKSREMRQKIIAAMVYPAVLGTIALLIIIALMVFVVPTVVEQFETMGQELPPLTVGLMAISEFMVRNGLFLLAGLALAIFLINRALAVEGIRRRFDRFVLGMPVFGKLASSVSAARFSRTFATLATSGSPALDSLMAARETTPNLVVRDAVDEVIVSVREGGALSSAMSRTGRFPPLVVHMASSGEASGELGAMFDKGAAYLEAEFENASKVALSLLEPMITIIMGGLVMLIILAIMLPILQLNSSALL